jgi:hypothetical protein
MATSPTLRQEVEELVLEQIRAFKRPADMNDYDLFECHLRHYVIMTLYHKLDGGVPAVDTQLQLDT